MENIIPLNGRIAIVDDKIEQALPLMRVFSNNNIPYTYYKGNDMEFLPKVPENDIRILFLDLNLFEGRNNQQKDIKSSLFSVIKHLISANNYPYILILWSLQEDTYKKVLEELFKNDLKECAPIIVKNWIKSDFFSIDTEEEINIENECQIIEKLKGLISELPAYSYLMQWENCVHCSSDITIQNIFHDYHTENNWQEHANCILDMFAHSYLEKHYEDSSEEDKGKASLMFFNDIYNDTLEKCVGEAELQNATKLENSINYAEKINIKAKINRCLLMSNSFDSARQPGCVIEIENNCETKKTFYDLLDNSLKTLPQKMTKEDIYNNMMFCEVVVTPACDYAQSKAKFDRIVLGVIIDDKYRNYIDDRSEAIYFSPTFNHNEENRVLILNFRYFITRASSTETNVNPLFRMRNSILSEIQSKLARHISRQGIMNL